LNAATLKRSPEGVRSESFASRARRAIRLVDLVEGAETSFEKEKDARLFDGVASLFGLSTEERGAVRRLWEARRHGKVDASALGSMDSLGMSLEEFAGEDPGFRARAYNEV
jgi:hypothetical protein